MTERSYGVILDQHPQEKVRAFAAALLGVSPQMEIKVPKRIPTAIREKISPRS